MRATSNAGEVSAFFLQRADGVRLFGAAASATLGKLVKDIMLVELRDASPRAEVHSGDGPPLADSFSARSLVVTGGVDISFESDAPYALYVRDGTGIYHSPDPHSAWDVYGFQAFLGSDGMVYTMHTHHEGQEPDDYVERALDAAEPKIGLALQMLDGRLSAVFV